MEGVSRYQGADLKAMKWLSLRGNALSSDAWVALAGLTPSLPTRSPVLRTGRSGADHVRAGAAGRELLRAPPRHLQAPPRRDY
eukprot:1564853-Rhodomonas_salina.1